MRKKVIYLSTCSTCVRIMKEVGIGADFEHHNLKEKGVSETDLEEMKAAAGSYEALFNKRAQKYRSEGLNLKTHTEEEWKKLILGEYTFIKRPVIFVGDAVFIGNAKATTEALKNHLAD